MATVNKGKWALIFLLIIPTLYIEASSSSLDPSIAKKKRMSDKVRRMFYHAYDNYMMYAFPHDELKPLTRTYTDSLSELGNLNLENLPQEYNGSALTLIESLSSLAVLGNHSEFERAVLWLSENLTFDVDVRINLFECNIRVLGGLVSAHILATDSTNRLTKGIYKNQLLDLAEELGQRFLPAFDTPTGLPYAWTNLKGNVINGVSGTPFVFKYGVVENETTETSTSGCGSLILEMGALSRLTSDPRFESAALRALRKLWSMRSSLNLFGTTLDVETGEWIEYSSGIGAGVDSFYEYLLKAHLLFGSEEFWRMFQSAYVAVQKYFRHGPWYHEADMRTGRATYWQLTSLQAFWPGLQVLVGDIAAANSSHREFFYVWEKFGVLPERYLLDYQMLHPTEKYYPLRPEFAESTFYLYQATKDPWYLEVGESIVDSLNLHTRVGGGFASVRDVTTMELEDHQHSFFLAETCKYLYLLFDDSFLANRNYIFTTEGHPLPILSSWHERIPEAYIPSNWTSVKSQEQPKRASAMSLRLCPAANCRDNHHSLESACHIPDARPDHRCLNDEDCGVDSTSCRWRSCSMAGYCGLWLSI
ncbi:Alpha-mannosidase I mns5 [Orobanche hederae]